jgi:hypothetical protein
MLEGFLAAKTHGILHPAIDRNNQSATQKASRIKSKQSIG